MTKKLTIKKLTYGTVKLYHMSLSLLLPPTPDSQPCNMDSLFQLGYRVSKISKGRLTNLLKPSTLSIVYPTHCVASLQTFNQTMLSLGVKKIEHGRITWRYSSITSPSFMNHHHHSDLSLWQCFPFKKKYRLLECLSIC